MAAVGPMQQTGGPSPRGTRDAGPVAPAATAVRPPARVPVATALLVVNPASRRGSHYREAALRAFARAGVRCDTVMTTHPGQGAHLATTLAPGYDAVFTLGGDGTAIEVVSALAAAGGPPVGILAGGTGNLLARTLGIPLNVRRAVPHLLAGGTVEVDLGVLAGAPHGRSRRFVFAAGVGIDASMVANVSATLKRHLGLPAYVLSYAVAALRRETFHVIVTVDGERIELAASAVMVANFGAVLSDLIWLGPGILHDDGKLDLCVFSPGTLRDAVRVAWKLVRKDFRGDPCMLFRSGRHFRVETIPPRPVQADGELLGDTPFDVTVEPLAARLLVPRRARMVR